MTHRPGVFALRALATVLAGGAIAVTAGWVVEHEDAGHYEATATGSVRDLGGAPGGRALAVAVVSGSGVANELFRRRTFLEEPAVLRRAVSVQTSRDEVRVTARGSSADYVATLANRWMDAANGLLERAVAAPPGRGTALLLDGSANEPDQPGRFAVARILARERGASRVATNGARAAMGAPENDQKKLGRYAQDFGAVVFDAPDLIAVTAEAVPPRAARQPGYARFGEWLAGGMGIGFVGWAIATSLAMLFPRRGGAGSL